MMEMIEMIQHATLVGKAVLIILALLSVLCWATFLVKWQEFSKAAAETAELMAGFEQKGFSEDLYNRVKGFTGSPQANIFTSAYEELKAVITHQKSPHGLDLMVIEGHEDIKDVVESMDRYLHGMVPVEMARMENWLSILASTAAASPFIGLFGTVIGILDAFHKIGKAESVSIQTIGPAIAEALIATAVGLGAAIPALYFYNYFSRRIQVTSADVEYFITLLLFRMEQAGARAGK